MKNIPLALRAAALVVVLTSSMQCLAQSSPLSGRVSSAEEGAMSGVLVSARREGTPVTVTVVSDDAGRFSYPAGRLAPGRHTIAIRAAGFVLGINTPQMNHGAQNQLRMLDGINVVITATTTAVKALFA